MNKFLLSSVALVGLTAGAVAADLPSRRAPPPAYVAVPVFTWTGFYVGANAGYGFATNSNNNNYFGTAPVANGTVFGTGTSAAIPTAGTFFGSNRSRDGFVGGGQAGYNYQIGSWVVGVEGDIQYTDFGNRRGATYGTAVPAGANIAVPGALGNVAFYNNKQSDFYGTIRGRAGYAFDRTLVYATGGVAFRDDTRNNQVAFNFPSLQTQRPDSVGYVVGGGVEYAFTPNITGRVEGFYVNFGGNGGAGSVVGVTNTGRSLVATVGSKRDDDFAVVRAGVNYKFTSF